MLGINLQKVALLFSNLLKMMMMNDTIFHVKLSYFFDNNSYITICDHECHFFPLLSPRRSITFPPTVPVLLKESAPFVIVPLGASFSLFDSDLNRFKPVPPKFTPVLPRS